MRTRVQVKQLVRRDAVPPVISLVVAANGFLNLAVGLASFVGHSLGVESVPDYLLVSPAMRGGGVVSVVLGIVLLVVGKGLFERRARAWKWALAVLGLLLLHSLYGALCQGSIPATLWLTVLLLVGLLVFRRHFQLRVESRMGYAQVVALASVLFAFAYAIVGSYLLRAEFNGIGGWVDAVYFSVVTYSTVGYGDITPASETARLFTVTLIPIGLAAFATALSALVGPAMERRMKGVLNLMQRIHSATNHVIICGFTHVSETVIDELQKTGTRYLVIEASEEITRRLESKGHEVLAGDPAHRNVLQEANFSAAAALVSAFENDSDNILVAVTAKELRDEKQALHPRIIVRIEDEENIPKALRIGADDVVSPSTLGGQMMAEKVSRKTTSPVAGDAS